MGVEDMGTVGRIIHERVESAIEELKAADARLQEALDNPESVDGSQWEEIASEYHRCQNRVFKFFSV
jgi:ActR/RegA family two-component response regulator